MNDTIIIGGLVSAVLGLASFIVWLVQVLLRSFNKNTEAMTHLSKSIDNMPEKLLDKLKLAQKE